MINVKNYNAARNVANFVVDSVDEIALLPDLTKGGSLGLMDMGPVAMGSTVMIPTTGAVYMLNGNNVYTQIGIGGGGGGSSDLCVKIPKFDLIYAFEHLDDIIYVGMEDETEDGWQTYFTVPDDGNPYYAVIMSEAYDGQAMTTLIESSGKARLYLSSDTVMLKNVDETFMGSDGYFSSLYSNHQFLAYDPEREDQESKSYSVAYDGGLYKPILLKNGATYLFSYSKCDIDVDDPEAQEALEDLQDYLAYSLMLNLFPGTYEEIQVTGTGGGGGTANAVLYTPQNLTDAQKLQARNNIGAGTGSGGDVPDNVVLFEETEDDVPNPIDQYIAENLGISFNAETRYLDLTFGSVTLDHVSIDYTTVPCSAITLNKSTVNVTVGDTETLVATIAPSDCEQLVRWFSEDKSIATVDSTGKITGVSAGSVNIVAKCGTKTATCAVTCVNSEWPKTASYGTRIHPTFPSGSSKIGGTVDNNARGTTNILAIKINAGDTVSFIYRGADTDWYIGASATSSQSLSSDASSRLTDKGEWIELSVGAGEGFATEPCQNNISRSFDPGWAQITPNVAKTWTAPYSGLMFFNFKHGSVGTTPFTDAQLLDMKNFTFDVTRAE